MGGAEIDRVDRGGENRKRVKKWEGGGGGGGGGDK